MKTRLNSAGRFAHLSSPFIATILLAVWVASVFVQDAASQTSLYWTETDRGAIYRMDADGSSSEALLSATLYHPTETVVDLGAGKVYWVEVGVSGRDLIRRANLDGTQIEILAEADRIMSIALDRDASKIYWTGKIYWWTGPQVIQRANLDGSEHEIVKAIADGADLKNIALDVESDKMYWTTSDAILRANLDGSEEEELISHREPGHIALDLNADVIYWTAFESIYRANLDGSHIIEVVNIEPQDERYIGALLIDSTESKMYWTDHPYGSSDQLRYRSILGIDPQLGRILRANLDGTDAEVLLTDGQYEPTGLSIVDDQLYWMDRILGRLQRANRDGSDVEDLITSSIADPQHLALDEQGNKMYWIEQNLIRRANRDGSDVENLVVINNPGRYYGFNPRGFTLDLQHGKMYWSSWDGWTPAGGGGFYRADLDGHNIEELSSDGTTGIAVDPVHEKMYWCDIREGNNSSRLLWAHLDGSEREELSEGEISEVVLDPDGGMYYYIQDHGSIHRANLDGTGSTENLITLGSPRGLALDLELGKMYWVANDHDILRANLDGSGSETIATFEDLSIGDLAIAVNEQATVIEVDDEVPGNSVLTSAYPNPFNAQASFTLTVVRSQQVRLDLMDTLGRIVAVLYEGPLSAQTPHRFTINGSAFASGVYIYRATGEDFQQKRNAVLLR